MNVRNCRGCGRIFNYLAGPHLCPVCREKLEEKFQEVKEYIKQNKGVGIPEVAESCDVDINQITFFNFTSFRRIIKAFFKLFPPVRLDFIAIPQN